MDQTRVDGLLNAHAAALLAGDEPGWLDVAEPTKPDVVTWYRQLYATLHALQVTWFEYRVPDQIADGRAGPRPEQTTIDGGRRDGGPVGELGGPVRHPGRSGLRPWPLGDGTWVTASCSTLSRWTLD